jgi:hypothetical protein
VFGKEDVLCLIVESTRWFWTMNPSYSKGRLQRFNLQEKSSQGELTLDVKLGRKCPLQTHNREKITKFFRENPDKKAIDLMGTCEPSFPDWMNEDVYEIIDYRGNVHIAKVDPSRQWMSEGLERKIIKSESGIS